MKRSDKDGCGFTCFAVVFLFLLIVILIFLSNDNFYKKINESSGIAAWFQGLGTLLAIFGVWWQTRRQIDSLQEAKNAEESKRKNDTLVRSRFILNSSRLSCEKIFEFHEKHLDYVRMHIQQEITRRAIIMHTYGGSDLPKPNYQQYKDVLSTTVLHLLNIPYWDIVDAHYANELLAIQNQARLCILSLDYNPYSFLDNLKDLKNMIEKAENKQ